MKTKKQIREEKYTRDYERLCDMILKKEPKIVRVIVEGYITLSEDNLESLKVYGDAHQAITYSLHLPWVDTTYLQYREETKEERKEREREKRLWAASKIKFDKKREKERKQGK